MKQIFISLTFGLLLFSCSDGRQDEGSQTTSEETLDYPNVATDPVITEEVYLFEDVNASSKYFDAALKSFTESHPSEAADNIDLGIQALMSEGEMLEGDRHKEFDAVVNKLEDLSSNLREQKVSDRSEIEKLTTQAQLDVANEYVVDLISVGDYQKDPRSYTSGLEAASRSIMGAEAHLNGEVKAEARKLVTEARDMMERLRSGKDVPTAEVTSQRDKMSTFLKRAKS